ncbi:5802_t:CDS:2, partial [Ambispora gerdemannii]
KKREGTSGKQFTNAEKLKDNFFANSERRRKAGDKANDCEALAQFFNATASISDDVEQIKLSANEQIFNQKKQTLTSKIQGLISKCQTSNSYSIANICYPKHQKDLLKLETEAKQAENEYKENKAKADQETDPDKKAQFMYLANKAAKKAEDIKRRVKANPLADLSRFSNLDDLEILLGGNVPKNPPTSRPKPSSNSSGGSTPTPNPLEDPKDFFEQYKTQIFISLALINMKKKQQQQLLIVLLLCAGGYYFLVYLPEEDKNKTEKEKQQTQNNKSEEELKAEQEEDA